MFSSFITINKYALSTHWNACKSFLLLSSWAAVMAYALMLPCMYPYPVSVAELVTVFLKLVCLSNGVTVSIYIALMVTKAAAATIMAELRSKAMVKIKKEEILAPDLFTTLSMQTSSTVAEPELYYIENPLQPSFC